MLHVPFVLESLQVLCHAFQHCCVLSECCWYAGVFPGKLYNVVTNVHLDSKLFVLERYSLLITAD